MLAIVFLPSPRRPAYDWARAHLLRRNPERKTGMEEKHFAGGAGNRQAALLRPAAGW
jgi:hypothetical protein